MTTQVKAASLSLVGGPVKFCSLCIVGGPVSKSSWFSISAPKAPQSWEICPVFTPLFSFSKCALLTRAFNFYLPVGWFWDWWEHQHSLVCWTPPSHVRGESWPLIIYTIFVEWFIILICVCVWGGCFCHIKEGRSLNFAFYITLKAYCGFCGLLSPWPVKEMSSSPS